MTKAAELAKMGEVLTNSQIGGRRNIIINGGMNVAQRSSSAVAVSNNSNEGYQTVDRINFGFGNNAGGACNISQDTTVPSGLGFSNSYKVDVTTADTSIDSTHQIFFRTILEARDIRNSGWNYTDSTGNSKITCSFYARSNKAGTYCFSFRSIDASGNMYYVKEFTLVADTWKRVVITIPSNSSLVFDDDTNSGAVLAISLQAGSDRNNATDDTWNTSDTSLATSNQVNFFDDTANNFFLTGWQLEVGSVATPFENRSFGEELQLCQRYLHRINSAGSDDTQLGTGFYNSSTAVRIFIPFPTTMRGIPAITTLDAGLDILRDSSSDTSINLGAAIDQTTHSCGLNITNCTSTTVGEGVILRLGFDSADNFFEIDAEL